jgi:hypothetical protein
MLLVSYRTGESESYGAVVGDGIVVARTRVSPLLLPGLQLPRKPEMDPAHEAACAI